VYLLQLWYGSVEQGRFGLAMRWSALVLVATSAGLMIFWREIAKMIAEREWQAAALVYDRFSRILFLVSAILCIWLCGASRTLVTTLAGDEYREAGPVLMVMAFYPLSQTYGQLNAAVLKAAERTATFRNLVLLVSVPDLALTYFLLAPPTARPPGLGLGALGVALKTAGYGLISVQAYGWSSRNLFGLRYRVSLLQRLRTLAILAACGVLTMGLLDSIIQHRMQLGAVSLLAIETMAYGLLVGVLLIAKPSLFAITAEELSQTYKGA